MKTKIYVLLFFLLLQQSFAVTKVFLNTNYKVSYINYSNLDFNFSSSTDTYNKFYSNLVVDLNTIIDNFEFNTELCSIGEWGVYNLETSSPMYFSKEVIPYPNITFLPWFAEFYVKYKYEIVEPFVFPYLRLPVDTLKLTFSVGRQRKQIVEGLVVGDNKIGYDSISLSFDFGKYFYFDSFFTKQVSKYSFFDNKSFEVYSFVFGSKFFQDFDFGINNTIEYNSMVDSKKIFYEFYLSRKLENYFYIFEYILQRGVVSDNNYDGSLLFFKGKVFGENKYLGKSSAGMVWLLSSGGSQYTTFLPSLSKMYDYMEPYGYGEFARANIKTLFFGLPDGYSGMFILGMNIEVTPLKKLGVEFNYYLYSSPNAPDNKPDPSATERTLGAKKAIGLEYGLVTTYKLSQMSKLNFSYSIFNPTKNAYSDKPKGDPTTKIMFSLETKF